tara:strand:- start:944 stop:1972 length:1029 start_codon:yes stop_codon:yes gene_type:complete
MAFKMKGNSLHKGTRGHKSALKQKKQKKVYGPITEAEWNEQTNTGTKGIPEDGGAGMEFLKSDLLSEGYKKRLANEIAANEKNKDAKQYIKRAPNEEELEQDPDKSTARVYGPTSEDIMDIRTNRSENIMFNDPSAYDKEGRYIGAGSQQYANADYVKKGKGSNEGENTNRLMPSSNINFSDAFDWEGDQKNRIEGGDLIAHEGAHAITAGEHGMLDNTKTLLNTAKGGEGELAVPQEVYARYKVTQKYLKNQGLFDAFSGEEFTNKDVKQIEKLMEGVTKDNYKSKGIPYEVFTFFGDDKQHPHGFNKKLSNKDMKNIFNNVADNSQNEIIDDGGIEQQFA